MYSKIQSLFFIYLNKPVLPLRKIFEVNGKYTLLG